MISNILVLTDFSYDAYNALFYATQLYKHQKCTFHILHAYDLNSDFKEEFKSSGKTDLMHFIDNRVTECLQETQYKIIRDTEKNALHNFITVSKNNSLENAVNYYISQNNIDLIAIGTKGKTGALDIFFGSNTIKMVKNKIGCPLLCIPKQIDYRPISQIGYITSLNHSPNQKTLKTVKSLASFYEAVLHLVHVSEDSPINTNQKNNKVLLEKDFKNTCLKYHNIPREKSIAKTVAKFAEKIGISILVISYYPHYFLDKLFREPVALDLSFYTETPLLILPIQE
ncbi:universal stress protein [uncultured Croceitalea sp.]|uniref:universal stress protein n=1 Tax=uncultured Croceitalea sp. TaxID=1798908 RepID=UPI00374E5038